MLLLGHAAGTIEGNLHLRCPDETPTGQYPVDLFTETRDEHRKHWWTARSRFRSNLS